MKAKKWWIVPAMVVVVCAVGLWAGSFVQENRRDSLVGLQGIGVIVETLRPDFEKEVGLTDQILTNDIELSLRQYGIKVLTSEERSKTSRLAFLYLNVNTGRLTDQPPGYIFNILLRVRQTVDLRTVVPKSCSAITWQTMMLGIAPTDQCFDTIRQQVKIQVEEFINEYLAANPKTTDEKN